jgi:hypothetical protein
MALAERPNRRNGAFSADMREKNSTAAGPEIPMSHILMNCSVPIHCTLVVRNIVMVACAEPWFTHAVAIGAILAQVLRLPKFYKPWFKFRNDGFYFELVAVSIDVSMTLLGPLPR